MSSPQITRMFGFLAACCSAFATAAIGSASASKSCLAGPSAPDVRRPPASAAAVGRCEVCLALKAGTESVSGEYDAEHRTHAHAQ